MVWDFFWGIWDGFGRGWTGFWMVFGRYLEGNLRHVKGDIPYQTCIHIYKPYKIK